MTEAKNKHWYGWLPIIAAILMLSFWILFAILLPMQTEYIKWVMDSDWTWINLIGFIGSSFGVLALTAIFSFHPVKNIIDLFAFGLTILGILMLTCILFFEAFILKGIAIQNKDLINLNGSFYRYPIFQLASISGGILLTSGFLILGMRMLFQRTFKKWKLILLMIACPLFGIVKMPGNIRLLGVLLYSTAFISIGIEMINNKTDTKT